MNHGGALPLGGATESKDDVVSIASSMRDAFGRIASLALCPSLSVGGFGHPMISRMRSRAVMSGR